MTISLKDYYGVNATVNQSGAEGGIVENNTTISSSYTIPVGRNGLSVGPITVADGTTVTVPNGQRWVVL
jgi:hypothetical protein